MTGPKGPRKPTWQEGLPHGNMVIPKNNPFREALTRAGAAQDWAGRGEGNARKVMALTAFKRAAGMQDFKSTRPAKRPRKRTQQES